MTNEFIKLNNIFSAIKDIDRIYTGNSNNKIDEALLAIKDIDTSEFSDEVKEKIIIDIREGLLGMYRNLHSTLHTGIEAPGGLIDNTRKENIPEKGYCITDQRNKEED